MVLASGQVEGGNCCYCLTIYEECVRRAIGLTLPRRPDGAVMPHFWQARQQLSTMDSLNHNARIEAIITVLESQERVNYAATIKR